jgi:multidrug efflux system outer membrane protein
MRRTWAASVMALFLAGCTVGPKYHRPSVQPPTDFYAERQITTSSEADLAWWDLFKDPVLQGLVREALKNNYDLQTAVARVEQERALAGVTRSEYFPQVGYGASIYGQKDPFPLVASHTYYSYNLNTIWEVDLFGRIRRLNEAQRAVYFGSEEAKRDVRLLVLTEVAQGYFQVRSMPISKFRAEPSRVFRTLWISSSASLRVVLLPVSRSLAHERLSRTSPPQFQTSGDRLLPRRRR